MSTGETTYRAEVYEDGRLIAIVENTNRAALESDLNDKIARTNTIQNRMNQFTEIRVAYLD